MTKLADTQCVLLSAAAQRDDGSLLPLPTLRTPASGIAKSLASLVARGFAEEREVLAAAQVHRTDGDLRFGLFLTAAGADAIGLGDGKADASITSTPAGEPPVRLTKSSMVMGLLARNEGATLADLMEATGWLPHTTRAALTGIRKKGVQLEKSKRDDATCYRAVAA